MIWIVAVVLMLLLAFWYKWRQRNARLIELSKKIPGPRTLPLLGNALKFMVNSKRFIAVVEGFITTYGDVFRFWLGPDLNIVVSNPDDIKILLSNPDITYKGPQYKYMADVIGDGILSGSGPVWRKHRKIATPNYNKRSIESYTDIFNTEIDILLDELNHTVEREFNVYKPIVKTTSYIVCQSLMGLSRKETLKLPFLHEIIDTTPAIYRVIFARMTKWYLQISPIFMTTTAYKLLRRCMEMIKDFSTSIIRSRETQLSVMSKSNLVPLNTDDPECNHKLSVIDRFIVSKELNNTELLDETFTVFTSSQEASAKISSALLLMLACHPQYQEVLYEEICSVVGTKSRVITNEDLKRMPYLDMVFKEVLRLFPIGAMLQRTVKEDITINSCTIPAGSSLVIPIYHLHRNSRYWLNPNAFIPERFTPENMKKRDPYCYIPFSLGPMDCLGRHFATQLIKTVCIKVLQSFELSSLNKFEDIRVIISISAEVVDGYNVVMTPRNK